VSLVLAAILAVTGQATWYEAPQNTAAAGPALRDALGRDWRGQWVTVSRGDDTVTVQLTDWCACKGSRIIDLNHTDFAELAPLDKGVIGVEVNPVDLPRTDTALSPVWTFRRAS
jgi:hypothetical protein